VSTNASGLNAGVYTGQITLAATNSFITFKQIMIPVVLTVNVFAQPNVKAIVNAADATGTLLGAPNTWMTLYGTNLAPPEHARSWQTSDFINNQMPTNLDGVSVSFGGASGYISYISPTQINVLTPPSGTALDEMQLTISLGAYSVTNCGSNPWPAVAVGGGCLSGISFDLESPAFFTFDGQHVAAEHADGSLIGPASLIPGQTAPAKPGEAIVLYGNGFGTTSIPIIPGSVSQSGALPSMPIVEIGGLGAAVQFAGSISPGLYQINVVVPASAIDGDNILSAIYDKMNTQPGVFLSVQH
jgi:uncharacterized protein (TIGR03437 family)